MANTADFPTPAQQGIDQHGDGESNGFPAPGSGRHNLGFRQAEPRAGQRARNGVNLEAENIIARASSRPRDRATASSTILRS